MSASSLRQAALFDEVNAELPPSRNGAPASSNGKKRNACQSRPSVDDLQAVVLAAFNDIERRIASLELLLKDVSERLDSRQISKEYYTTIEVARILQKKPYTVREWCRLGRVNGEKAHSGRGLDEEWRISHQELLRIQNEGLLSIGKVSRVSPPPRLPK